MTASIYWLVSGGIFLLSALIGSAWLTVHMSHITYNSMSAYNIYYDDRQTQSICDSLTEYFIIRALWVVSFASIVALAWPVLAPMLVIWAVGNFIGKGHLRAMARIRESEAEKARLKEQVDALIKEANLPHVA